MGLHLRTISRNLSHKTELLSLNSKMRDLSLFVFCSSGD